MSFALNKEQLMIQKMARDFARKELAPLAAERAYHEIGYPNAHFNDRLVSAIDDLLAAPDLDAPVRLAQPKILFEYADADLENRSAGQKIMMRIGSRNAAVLKSALRGIRQQVANAPGPR